MTCHHNHGPLFSHSPWSESNSFEATRNLIKAALPGQTSYMGAPIEPVDNGGRQGPAGQMESAARLGGELLDALALYQRFRPVCPPNQPDCAAYKKTNAPEQFRKELHLAAYEDKCLGIYPGDNARLTRLGPIRNAFVKADFPTGVYRPDDLVDDLVPRFGNVADHLQTAIVDPTKRRPFPTQIMVLAFDDGSTSPSPLDWAVRALGDDYEPNCHHLKTIPIAKLE
jgi:hypothetical protein